MLYIYKEMNMMSRFLKLFAYTIALGALLFSSCKKEKEEYTITVLSADEQKGSVKGGGTFEEGSKITIEAEALEGYHFARWDDGIAENPRTVEVVKNYTYIAQFISDTLRGSIYENTTLRKGNSEIDYIIDGELRIEGSACVTIEPGVKIAFTDTTGGIYVTDDAALKMEGTQESPITFQGLKEKIGGWGAIRYASKRAENIMKHVILNNGGNKKYLVDLGNSKVSIEDCTFNGSLGYGISGGTPILTSFTNNTISNCGISPISFASLDAFQNIGEGNQYKDNKENLLVVNGSDQTIYGNLNIKKQAISYYIKGGAIILQGNASVKIEPGVKFYFDYSGAIKVGEQATLIAEGTESEHIEFTPYGKGTWDGLRFSSEKGSKLSYCDFNITREYAITVEGRANANLSNIAINESQFGINIVEPDNRHMVLKVANFLFSNCKKGNIYYDYWDEIHDAFEDVYPIKNEFNIFNEEE